MATNWHVVAVLDSDEHPYSDKGQLVIARGLDSDRAHELTRECAEELRQILTVRHYLLDQWTALSLGTELWSDKNRTEFMERGLDEMEATGWQRLFYNPLQPLMEYYYFCYPEL